MGFWDELGKIAGKALIAAAGSTKIIEWLELELDDAEMEIQRYVRYASSEEIKLTFEGFVALCTNQIDSDRIRHVLLLYRSFCICTAKRFGED